MQSSAICMQLNNCCIKHRFIIHFLQYFSTDHLDIDVMCLQCCIALELLASNITNLCCPSVNNYNSSGGCQSTTSSENIECTSPHLHVQVATATMAQNSEILKSNETETKQRYTCDCSKSGVELNPLCLVKDLSKTMHTFWIKVCFLLLFAFMVIPSPIL